MFLYKPQAHSRLHSGDDEDEADKMAFDDTELSFFVNQGATSGSTSSEIFVAEDDQLMENAEHWDMDAMTFAQTHSNDGVASESD